MRSVSVDHERFEAASSILDRETEDLDRKMEETLPDPDWRFKWLTLPGPDWRYKWLNWVGYGIVIGASLVGVAWSLYGLLGLNETFWYVVYVYIWTSILFSFLPGMTFVFMIGLNWPLVLDVRRLDWETLREPWAGQRAKRQALNAVTLLVGPALWGWGLFFMAFVLSQPLPEKTPRFLFPVPGLEELRPVAFAVFLCFLWTLLVGYMCLWLHLLRCGKDRLRFLQSSLRDVGKSAEQRGKIPRREYDQVARMEQVRISKERAKSVQNFFPDAQSTSVVKKSHSVAKQLELDPGVGMQVQAAIDGEGSTSDDTDQQLSEFEICYTEEAKVARDKLSEEVLTALKAINKELSANPTTYTRHTKSLDAFVYEYPKPEIQLTLMLDVDRKVVYVIRVDVPQLPPVPLLFISYSHKDEKWLGELMPYLRQLDKNNVIKTWNDQQIEAGAQWNNIIREALFSAEAAVLLVTQNFLDSAFINSEELPELVKAAKSHKAKLFWIPFGSCTFEDTVLEAFHAVISPEPPLEGLEEPDRNKKYKEIYKTIKDQLKR